MDIASDLNKHKKLEKKIREYNKLIRKIAEKKNYDYKKRAKRYGVENESPRVIVPYIEYLLKFEHKCFWCKTNLGLHEKTIDHIRSMSNGGGNTRKNICVCCVECQKKRSKMLQLNKKNGVEVC